MESSSPQQNNSFEFQPPEGFYKAVETKEKFDDVLDNLNLIVNGVISRDNMMLKYQYNPKLDNAKRKVIQLENKIKDMKNAYTSHQELTTIINELRDYEKVANTLRNKLDFLESQLNKEKAICERLQKHNEGRREELNVLNKDNLKISYEIEEIMDQIKELKNPQSFFLTNESRYIPNNGKNDLSVAEKSLISNIKRGMNLNEKGNNDHQISTINANIQSQYTVANLKHPQVDMTRLSVDQQEEVAYYISQIARLDTEHRNLKTSSIKTVSKQFDKQRKAIELEEFFRDCIKACEKDILKSHEISQLNQDDKVSSSFFFELKRKKFLNDNQKLATQGPQQLNDIKLSYPMTVLDRHTKNVIYKTIKQIINTAKEEKKKAHIMSIQLEWEEFRKFTPMQIMGLLLLRDDALEKMQDFMFPSVAKSKGRLTTQGNTLLSQASTSKLVKKNL
eukprot:403331608